MLRLVGVKPGVLETRWPWFTLASADRGNSAAGPHCIWRSVVARQGPDWADNKLAMA